METTKQKSTRGVNVTVVFSASDGERVRRAAEIRKESMSRFVRTTIRERLRSLGYFTEEDKSVIKV